MPLTKPNQTKPEMFPIPISVWDSSWFFTGESQNLKSRVREGEIDAIRYFYLIFFNPLKLDNSAMLLKASVSPVLPSCHCAILPSVNGRGNSIKN